MEYITRQNDLLDDVVYRYYGDTERRIVEAVLEANRGGGLADYGVQLPEGLTITLPDRSNEPTGETLTRLWD